MTATNPLVEHEINPRVSNGPNEYYGAKHNQSAEILGDPIPTLRNPHYQALAISLVWPTPLSFSVTKYLASQEYNRDIPLAKTIQE